MCDKFQCGICEIHGITCDHMRKIQNVCKRALSCDGIQNRGFPGLELPEQGYDIVKQVCHTVLTGDNDGVFGKFRCPGPRIMQEMPGVSERVPDVKESSRMTYRTSFFSEILPAEKIWTLRQPGTG